MLNPACPVRRVRHAKVSCRRVQSPRRKSLGRLLVAGCGLHQRYQRRKTRPIMEAGIQGLTEDAAPALIHFADSQTQQWLMVRLDDPSATTDES